MIKYIFKVLFLIIGSILYVDSKMVNSIILEENKRHNVQLN